MKTTLIIFFALTTLLSWGIWVPLTLTGNSNQWLLWLAGFTPTLSALALTIWQSGWDGLRRLLQFRWRVKAIWYLISLLGTPMVMLAAITLQVALGGDWPQYVDPNHMVTSLAQWPIVIIVFLYVFVFTSLGEEIGWRGYALPRLQAQFSPFVASLILGLVWAFWHLPLFWMVGNFHQQIPLTWFILQVVGSTFLYTWMYNRSDGSLWIMLIFHTASNAAIGLLPILPLDNGGSLRPLWLVVALLWLLVGLVLWFNRVSFFAPPRIERQA
jgi:membrane protease YdiL (CAAX protease family)